MDPFIGFFIEVEDGRAIGVRIGRWMYSAVMPKPDEGKLEELESWEEVGVRCVRFTTPFSQSEAAQ